MRLQDGAGGPVQAKQNQHVFGGKVNVCRYHKNDIFFGHVQLLRFIIVQIFWSCSNLNLVIYIRSFELASFYISRDIH